MRCEEAAERMQLDLDMELGEEEKARLQEHLATCAECRLLYNRMQQIHQQLESLPKVDPPFSIVDAILPELERLDQQRKTPLNRRLRFPSLGIAAAALLFLIGFYAGKTDWFPNQPERLADHAGSRNEMQIAQKLEMAPAVSQSQAEEPEGAVMSQKLSPAEKILLPSPDHTYTLFYTHSSIEVKGKDNKILFALEASPQETIAEPFWEDKAQFRFTLRNGESSVTWSVNLTEGVQTKVIK